MTESLGSASLRLEANPAPLTAGLAAAKAKTVTSMRGTSVAAAAAFAAGMVTVGAAVGVGLYKIGKEYQEAYHIIRTETGATGERMEQLKGSFKNVFGSTPASAKDTATALALVHKRTDQVGEPLEDLTLNFLRLAGATGEDVKGAIESTTRAFNDWGVEQKDQNKTLDGFFALSQKTGISVSDLADKLVQFGSPLRALGFDVNEGAAMFAAFEKAGVNVSTMMPGLRMALKNIAKPTGDLAKKFKDLGVDTKDPQAALAKIMDTIKGMKNPTDAASFAMDVFGARAGTDMAQAIREGKFEVSELVEVMKNSEGAIKDNAIANATLEGRLKILRHRVTNLIEPLATKLVGALTDVAGWLLDMSEKFQELPAPMRKTIGIVAMVAGGLVALAFALAKVKLAFSAMTALMAGNPYVLLIAATVGLVYLIVTNWDKIKNAISDAWKAIKKGAVEGWKKVRDFLKKNWQWIIIIFGGPLGILVGLIAGKWKDILKVTKGAWGKIRDAIKKAFKGATGFVEEKTGGLRGFLGDRWGNIKDGASGGWGKIKTAITTPFGGAMSFVRKRTKDLQGFLADRWGNIKDATKWSWDRITDFITDPIGTVRKTIRWFVDKIDEVWNRWGRSMAQNTAKWVTKTVNAIIRGFTRLYTWLKNQVKKIQDIPGIGDVLGIMGDISPLSAASPLSAPAGFSPIGATQTSPQFDVRVYIGDTELKDMMRVEIDERGRELGHVYTAGAGRVI